MMAMSAVRTSQLGHVEVRHDVPIPEVPEGYILVKTSHVALNPTDWEHVDYQELFKPDHTIGFDVPGVVTKVGANSTPAWQIGDRVAGAFWGCRTNHPESGSFGTYALIKSHLAIKVPDHWSLAQAATLGVGCVTAFASLYQFFGFLWPSADNAGSTPQTPVLIYGGSTSSGLFAIQFATLSGVRVITTCSPHNFEKVKSAGADKVFAYDDPAQCAAAISAATDKKLLFALDCVAQGNSAKICAAALTNEPGKARYASLLPVDFPRGEDDVLRQMTVVFPAWGEDVYMGGKVVIPAQPEEAALASKFMRLVETLLERDQIKTSGQLRDNGLNGIIDGLDELRKGVVSGQKLVYQL